MSIPPDHGPAAIAARLTWGALRGTTLDEDDRARLALGLGGVVLFERNIESPAQLRALTRSIRETAAGPVRIAIDQEGGHVTRIREPLTSFPGPMAIAATRIRRLAHEAARASAVELRSLGIDTVLAPVLDVAAVLANPSVGTRSFGADPRAVARFGVAAIRGYLAGGVIPIPKHVPGHGRTLEDSHVAQPRVAGTQDDLVTHDLSPFLAAVAAGAPALMTAHVIYDALDPGVPASLSPVVTRLVRDGLAFDGLLLTDALVMDAITLDGTIEAAAVRAIVAGADAVMGIEGQRRVLAGLEVAIAEHLIPPDRLVEAIGRAETLDGVARSLRGAPLGEPLAADVLARHARLADEIAARSITLVDGDAALLPIAQSASVVVIDVTAAAVSPIEGRPDPAGVAGERLVSRWPRGQAMCWTPDGAASVAAQQLAPAADVAIVLTRDAYAVEAVVAALASLPTSGIPIVHVALRNPLDLVAAGPTVRVAAYADTPATIDALADALMGLGSMPGRLPVTLPPSVRSLEAVRSADDVEAVA